MTVKSFKDFQAFRILICYNSSHTCAKHIQNIATDGKCSVVNCVVKDIRNIFLNVLCWKKLSQRVKTCSLFQLVVINHLK
jgi:hypothetical protein